MRPLNSAELGEKGEREFARLCTDAKLICNKADIDRAGWDFQVEFPFESECGPTPIELRPPAADCRAQVKAAWVGNKTCKLRLSSALRLAKLPQPACIFGFSIRDDLTIERIYALHVIDAVLDRILRETSKCNETDSLAINRRYIYMNFEAEGELIEPTHAALRTYIARIASGDREQYLKNKNMQIRTLGYAGLSSTAEFTVEASTKSDLLDILLGKKPGRFTALSRTETRWGTTRTLPDVCQSGSLTVKPHAHSAELVLKSLSRSDFLRLKVKVTVGHLSASEDMDFKIILKNSFAEFEISGNRNLTNLHVDFGGNHTRPLSEHLKRNKARILMCQPGEFTLREFGPTLFSGRYTPDLPEETLHDCLSIQCVLESLERLVEIGGLSSDQLIFSADQLDEQAQLIQFLSYMRETKTGIDLDPFDLSSEPEHPAFHQSHEALVFGRAIFENFALAFGGLGTGEFFRRDQTTSLEIKTLRLRRLEALDLSAESFRDFCQLLQAETAVNLSLTIGLVDPTTFSAR